MAIGVEKIKILDPKDKNIIGNHSSQYPRTIKIKADAKVIFEAEYFNSTPSEKKGRAKWIAKPENGTPYTKEDQSGVLGDRVEISIPTKFCGSKKMALEGFMNTPSNEYPTKVLVYGYAKPKIISTKWSKTKGGSDLGSTAIKFGDDIWLNIVNEGLNGSDMIIEIYNEQSGDDGFVSKYYSKCINGEINIKIKNTFNWMSVTGWFHTSEEKYLGKIRIRGKKEYLGDTNEVTLKKEVSTRNVMTSETARPLKLGETEINIERYETCRFKKLTFIDEGKNIDLFEEGKLKLRGETKTEFAVSEKIHFVVDKAEIRTDAKMVLDNLSTFLIDNPFVPVELGAHCDIRRDHAYNDPLSNRRAASSVAYLVGKGISADRISARGYGKRRLLIPGENLTEEQHEQNRRVTIKFKISGGDAQPMVYETIAPSKSKIVRKEIALRIDGLDSTSNCFKKGTNLEHDTNVKIISNTKEGQNKFRHDGTTDITHEIIAREPYTKLAPLEFIIPSKGPTNQYWYHIHTCRYYSLLNKKSVIVQVYPDIKWDFHAFLNLSLPLDASWQGLDSNGVDRMLKLSGQIAAQKRWKQTKVAMGVALNAHWNKTGEKKYQHSFDVAAQWEDKFKWAHKVFGGLQDISKGITKSTKGKASKLVGKKSDVEVTILQPNLSLGAEWQLARGEKNGVSISKLGTQVKVYLEAKPFVGLEIKIDLLNGALTAASYAITGNPVAADIAKLVRAWAEKGYESENVKVNLEMWIDVIIKGTLSASGSWQWNTESDKVEGEAKVEGKIGVELTAGVKLNAKAVLIKTGKTADTVSNQEGLKLDAVAQASASSGEIAIKMGANVKYKTEEGLYLEPLLFLEPCVANVIMLVEVKLSYKVISADWKPVNINEERRFWEEINIFENIVGSQPKLQILKP